MGCAACAQCSRREEEQLRALTPRSECDCTRDPGVDPCIHPTGCGCYCETLKYLKESCPEVVQGETLP
jgi:hypothetical protein